MSVFVVVWTAAGIAIGVTHAAALWRHAHRGGRADWSAVWRLPAVAAVLVGAAFAGALLPAAGGWAGGLASTSGVLYLGNRR